MSSASLRLALALLLALATAPVTALELKVCGDPNNLPFSNDRLEGFENRIAAVVADELHADLTWVWWAQRRGYIGNALNAGLCDLIPGIAGVDGVLLTYPPYYRSTYAVVTRPDGPPIASLDDPALRTVTVGVGLVGDDGANTPPAAALARRGIVANVRGYPVQGDYTLPNPAARLVTAVADGEVDAAIVWGPIAGYFAAHRDVPLKVTPLAQQFDGKALPLGFDISMALRLDEGRLRMAVEEALAHRKADIDAILAEYGVPRLDR